MRESRTYGSVRAKAEWLSYSTIIDSRLLLGINNRCPKVNPPSPQGRTNASISRPADVGSGAPPLAEMPPRKESVSIVRNTVRAAAHVFDRVRACTGAHERVSTCVPEPKPRAPLSLSQGESRGTA
jgi:hypothetical protein